MSPLQRRPDATDPFEHAPPHRPAAGPRLTAAVVLSLCASLVGACLGDDRCGPGYVLDGVRCQKILPDSGPLDSGNDSAPADGAPADGGADQGDGAVAPDSATCLTLSATQLAGSFDQQGTASQSTCQAPFPLSGSAFNGTLSFAEGDGGLGVSLTIQLPPATFPGTATVQADGTVKVAVQGSVLGITFDVQETLCFSSTDAATVEAQIGLSNANGELCSFSAPGTLSRK